MLIQSNIIKNVIRSVGISDEMKTYREVQFANFQKDYLTKVMK